jgi:hypothetical protein
VESCDITLAETDMKLAGRFLLKLIVVGIWEDGHVIFIEHFPVTMFTPEEEGLYNIPISGRYDRLCGNTGGFKGIAGRRLRHRLPSRGYSDRLDGTLRGPPA